MPALDEGRHADAARREIALALGELHGRQRRLGHLLALRIAAEAEAAGDGLRPARAALDYGEQLARLRWHDRLDAARLRPHAAARRADAGRPRALVRDALIDPLTGLANRRGYARWLRDQEELGIKQRLAMYDHRPRPLQARQRPGTAMPPATRSCAASAASSPGRSSATDLAVRIGGDERLVVLEAATGARRRGPGRTGSRWRSATSAGRTCGTDLRVAGEHCRRRGRRRGRTRKRSPRPRTRRSYRAKAAGGDRAEA